MFSRSVKAFEMMLHNSSTYKNNTASEVARRTHALKVDVDSH